MTFINCMLMYTISLYSRWLNIPRKFLQAQAYVRFRPDSEERSTYLYRAYTKWCEDNLESPVTQKKFSQFLLKNSGRYGLTFTKHIEGKYRGFRGVCVRPAFAA